MVTNNNNNNIISRKDALKFTIFIGLIFLSIIITYHVANQSSKKAEETSHELSNVKDSIKQNTAKTVDSLLSSPKTDSLLKQVFDDRFKSYDNRFMLENMVMVNRIDSIVGVPAIYTNDSIIEVYYSNKEKTKFYDNLKKGKIRIIIKK